MRAKGLRVIAIEEFVNYGKIAKPTSKTLLKMAGGRMHTLHPTPLDPHQVISYKNHQLSLAYFNHLVPLALFFLTKKQSQRGHGTMPP